MAGRPHPPMGANTAGDSVSGTHVKWMHAPSHVGIPGNTKADTLAGMGRRRSPLLRGYATASHHMPCPASHTKRKSRSQNRTSMRPPYGPQRNKGGWGQGRTHRRPIEGCMQRLNPATPIIDVEDCTKVKMHHFMVPMRC